MLVQIIEDEPLHADLLDRALRQAHFSTTWAADGERGWMDTQRLLPSLILLDLMLPGLSGHEICRLVRQTPITRHIPIIMLTAVGTEEDRIAGLEMGADDYVVKPFSPREVVSRVQAVLRRSRQSFPLPSGFSTDSLTVQEPCFLVSLQTRQLTLSDMELAILRFLLARPAELVSAASFMAALGRDHRDMPPERVDQSVRTLHRKLQNTNAGLIEILPGFRYRFHETPHPVSLSQE